MDNALVEAVLATNYLMRVPLSRDEVERVLWAITLAHYEVRPCTPTEVVRGKKALRDG